MRIDFIPVLIVLYILHIFQIIALNINGPPLVAINRPLWKHSHRTAMEASFETISGPREDESAGPVLKNISLTLNHELPYAKKEEMLSTSPNTSPKLCILISGPPCSGKGTQCLLLKEKYGLVHISTGDLLRGACKENNQLAYDIKSYLDSGHLVPDKIIVNLLKHRLSRYDCKTNGWILDGFPRTINQAKTLVESKIQPTHIFILEAPENILLRRSINRRLDPVTGKIYNIVTSPPESEEIKLRLIQRHDDTYDVMEGRIKNYNKESEAIREWYKDSLITLNGTADASVTYKEICEIIDSSLENAS